MSLANTVLRVGNIKVPLTMRNSPVAMTVASLTYRISPGAIKVVRPVSRDGKRFLFDVPLEQSPTPHITVILNWASR